VRTGYETSNVDGVMNGEIDDSYYLMMMGQKDETKTKNKSILVKSNPKAVSCTVSFTKRAQCTVALGYHQH
jgi:hypothetical protein